MKQTEVFLVLNIYSHSINPKGLSDVSDTGLEITSPRKLNV